MVQVKVRLVSNRNTEKIGVLHHAILQPDELLIVPNALLDERFATNPLVTSDQHPVLCRSALITPQGYALGTLCVDREPRQLQPQQVGFADFKSPSGRAA